MLYQTIISFVLITIVFTDNGPLINLKNGSHLKSLIKEENTFTKSSKMINCLSSCVFELSFNGSFTIPSSCTTYVPSRKCSIKLSIDYIKHKGSAFFERDNVMDDDFDVSIKAFGRFSFKENHNEQNIMWTYDCSINDNCSVNYFNKYILHYIGLTKQLQTLYDQFSTLLDYSGSHSPNVQQCYSNPNTLDNCMNGTCVYNSVREQNVTTQYCKFSQDFTRVLYEIVQTTPSTRSISFFDVVTFECNIDKCNSLETAAAVNKAIEENWGGILDTNSSSINLISLPFYMLVSIHFLLINLFL
ncbi:hypothetical protein I4U23_016194 [Adineta vaga]|nr:hypothetical protein I4U23_016194 [Adineta vaga]